MPMPRRKKDSNTQDVPRNAAVNGVEPAETVPTAGPAPADSAGPAADEGTPVPDRAHGTNPRRKPIRPPRHARPAVPFEAQPDAPFDIEIEAPTGHDHILPARPLAEDRVQLPVIPLRDMVIFPHMVTQF